MATRRPITSLLTPLNPVCRSLSSRGTTVATTLPIRYAAQKTTTNLPVPQPRYISRIFPRCDTAKPVNAPTSEPPPSKVYGYDEMVDLAESPDPNRIIIDVREPAELQSSGRIPTAVNVPIQSAPDALFLPETEFEDRFGFPRPDSKSEVIFYCKAGVRSRAAARMAGQAGFGGKVGEFPGSWVEWEKRGGKVEQS